MSEIAKSCLVEKLSHYIELDEDSLRHIASLEQDEKEFDRHSEINRPGADSSFLHVVKKGWLYTYTDMPDGRRQVVQIHHPGDVVGFADVAFKNASTTLRTAEDAILCPFPKKRLDVIFEESPVLTALLFSLAVREHALLLDSMRVMGRMDARERLSYMFLDILTKLRVTNKSITNTIRLPLNQTEIGDYIGLTNVYVSKSLIALEEDGVILRKDNQLTILKEDHMARMCDFQDRYLEIDTSWFPKARPKSS
ncbi:Crp/Fnr family transcriptional regulator [Maritalea sp.]|uniref:Crp/Fnr family transcriptional regulator n=1 Tax=Maritalea sp. TaxID=2003361 RepID=UPI003EF89D12